MANKKYSVRKTDERKDETIVKKTLENFGNNTIKNSSSSEQEKNMADMRESFLVRFQTKANRNVWQNDFFIKRMRAKWYKKYRNSNTTLLGRCLKS